MRLLRLLNTNSDDNRIDDDDDEETQICHLFVVRCVRLCGCVTYELDSLRHTNTHGIAKPQEDWGVWCKFVEAITSLSHSVGLGDGPARSSATAKSSEQQVYIQ